MVQQVLTPGQIEIVSGIAAGMVATFFSHPLDTIKVTIQLEKSERLKLK